MKKRFVVCMVVFGLMLFCVGQGIAAPTPVSVKLTSNALGLGTADINYDSDGHPVDPDIAGKFITSPVTGQGSILYVQNSGAAGMGAVGDPLLVTITAKSHLDTIGAPPDWYAGIISLTHESSYTPDGAEEGLGVRCFTVNPANGLRVIEPTTGRARIEGSKEVSGGSQSVSDPLIWNPSGTGGNQYPDPFDPAHDTKNGAPHVDEVAIFDFAKPMVANTVIARLSMLATADVINLSINIKRGGSTLVLSDSYLTTSEAPMVRVTGGSKTDVYDVVFANMPGLQAGDEVTSFQIRAIDPNDGTDDAKGTAEHFLISGFRGSIDELASLGDFVWHDLNANGIQDAGEPGIQSVTVNLLNTSNAVIATTTTNASGAYTFNNLSPGGYYVEFTKPASYNKFSPQDAGGSDLLDSDASTSTGKTALVTLTSGQSDTTRDAGMFQYASVGDFVWHDLNANGIQDAGEPGIQNVTVNLLNTSNAVIATTTTNASGAYNFNNLSPGGYYVEFTKPASYNQFSPQDAGGSDLLDSDASTSTGKTASITLTSGQSDTTRDAGMFQYASVGDFVWNDLNANGIQDAGEPGIQSVTVNLLNTSNAVIATTTTNASGLYSFAGLTPGSYTVQFTKPAGYDQFSPQDAGGSDLLDSDASTVDGSTALITLTSGLNDMTRDAGMFQYASVGDFVWNDLNANGIQDGGEPGVADVTVNLFDYLGNSTGLTTTTDGNGHYMFGSLIPGGYFVQFVLPGDYDGFTLLNAGGNPALDSDADPITGWTSLITLVSGQSDTSRDAGLLQSGGGGDQPVAEPTTLGMIGLASLVAMRRKRS